MQRLSNTTVPQIGSAAQLTNYSRDQSTGVIHLGIGAFHRAHQAVYFDDLLALGETDWMIQGASLRSRRVADQLNPQDGLFCVSICDSQAPERRVVRSVKNVIAARDEPKALIDAIAQETVSLVMLTVTEKGYRPALPSGGLDLNDDDVRHDIQNPDTPRTAVGFLTAGLKRRWQNETSALTILSCDNMPNNGAAVQRGVLALAQVQNADLAHWIEQNCAFPASMVDRIVPATTASHLETFQQSAEFEDQGLVRAEPFSQWVIEDWFAARRPPLDRVGVQFTSDVEAWEKAKLRLLNGAHSALAYLGALAGYDYIHQAVSNPRFSAYIDKLWDEAESTLDPIDGFDPKHYRLSLLERFKNSALPHKTHQIAMDGSQKIPQRFLQTILARRSIGKTSPALELAVAAWMRWQFGIDEAGDRYLVDDPLSDQTQRLVQRAQNQPHKTVAELLSLDSVFGTELGNCAGFAERLTVALSSLMERGAEKTVETLQSGLT